MYRNATWCLLHIMYLHIQSMTLSIYTHIYPFSMSLSFLSFVYIYIYESSTPSVCYLHHICLPCYTHVYLCRTTCPIMFLSLHTPSMTCCYAKHNRRSQKVSGAYTLLWKNMNRFLVPLTSEESHYCTINHYCIYTCVWLYVYTCIYALCVCTHLINLCVWLKILHIYL